MIFGRRWENLGGQVCDKATPKAEDNIPEVVDRSTALPSGRPKKRGVVAEMCTAIKLDFDTI